MLCVCLQYGILPADFDEQLDKVLTKLSFTFKSQGADKQGCKADLDDAEISCPGLSAQLAVYEADNGRTYEVTICTCPGGPYDANGLASLVSGIPQFLLYFVKGELSACYVIAHVNAPTQLTLNLTWPGSLLPGTFSLLCRHCIVRADLILAGKDLIRIDFSSLNLLSPESSCRVPI